MRFIVRLLNWLNLSLDILALNVTIVLCFWIFLDFSLFRRELPYILIINFCWLFVQRTFKLYDDYIQRNSVSIFGRTLKALALFFGMGAMVFSMSVQNDMLEVDFNRHGGFYFSTLLLFVFFALLNRLVLLIIRKIARQKVSSYKKNVVIVGHHALTNSNGFFNDISARYNVMAVFHDTALTSPDILYQGTSHACLDYLRTHQVDEVFCTLPGISKEDVNLLMHQADRSLTRFRLVPEYYDYFQGRGRVSVEMLDNIPIISGRREPLEEITNAAGKRLFDIVFSLLIIVLVLSWLLPVLALIIKMTSPGPVFFRQKRSGRSNEAFYCLKLRSMRVNSDADKVQAQKNDSRITPIGAFLRKTSLDELPQFFNVLVGNMSVVGPRPHMLKHTEDYAKIIDKFMVRHFVKPGITGWAQVTGLRGETRTTREMEERVEADVWYLEHWSFLLDMKIIFLTVWNICRGDKKAG